MRPLEPGASKAEVLAAVEEHERGEREIRDVEFPPIPEGYHGCVASLDATVLLHVGRIEHDDEEAAAQEHAGEEDQDAEPWL